MKPKPINCGNCKWATWELSEKGNIRRKLAGRCTHPIPEMPAMPSCFVGVENLHKTRIWTDNGTECPTFQPKATK